MPANQTTILAEPGKQEILITREFDAPRELVFKACTDPKLIPQWWGPRYLSTEVDKMDVRPGGQWRFLNRDAEGNEYAFHGVYHEVLLKMISDREKLPFLLISICLCLQVKQLRVAPAQGDRF